MTQILADQSVVASQLRVWLLRYNQGSWPVVVDLPLIGGSFHSHYVDILFTAVQHKDL